MHYTDPKVYEYISKKTSDPIVDWKTCAVSGHKFAIFQSDLDFLDKISPVFDGVKYQIPTPTLCPEERMRRRFSFRNERKLYRRKCDATNKNIISIYSPDKNYKVYDQDYRRSDQRDSKQYAQEIDPSKTFFQQLEELVSTVPHFSLFITNSENCDFNNALVGSSDCYLSSGSRNEGCMFSRYTNDCVNSVDGFMMFDCQECYNCNDCTKCNRCINTQNCDACSVLTNCQNCIGCNNCYNCNNLINKEYHINNKSYSKEEYERYLSTISSDTNTDTNTKSLYPDMIQKSCTNTIGSNISECKDCTSVFDCHNSSNLKYCSWFNDSNDCMDNYSRGKNAELCYENSGIGVNPYMNIGCFWCQNNSHLYYSFFCKDCQNCFGCMGLRNKSYCIFNKQYTSEQYKKIVPQIIQHMQRNGTRGEFLNPQLSPFGYNETIAQDNFPLGKEEALAMGYKWSDYEYGINIPENAPVINPGKLDEIQRRSLVDDDSIVNKIIICQESGKPFRIIKQELDFYRKHNLQLPRIHPDIRHLQRLRNRSNKVFHLRSCDNCDKEILSVYSKNDESKVYCKECYEKEVYS